MIGRDEKPMKNECICESVSNITSHSALSLCLLNCYIVIKLSLWLIVGQHCKFQSLCSCTVYKAAETCSQLTVKKSPR